MMKMKNKKIVCISVEERKDNEVDSLERQIKEIQEDCEHDWRLVEKPKLRESFVPGVFVGETEHCRIATEITLICIKCSKRVATSIIERCPYCLSLMRKGGLYVLESNGTDSRKRYFGKRRPYYAVRIFHCTECHFTVASDEWNQ